MADFHASKLMAAAGFFFCVMADAQVSAAPALVIDSASGAILHQEDATRPWFPASVTKLMTVYVALNAVRTKRLSLQTPLIVSNRAARAAPSKMGFKAGTEVTLENALKIIMVKSANDTAITMAEGISGSTEAFAAEMNDVAKGLGMRDSNFTNPNGLHHPAHVSSARDMAILARALLIDFPQHSDLYGIGALQLGRRIIPTHNGLLGRYPGADGMKTGFVCASGFNVVATATRNGRKLIAVIMGAPNARVRTLQAMALFDAAFTLSGTGNVNALPVSGGSAPDMRGEICSRGRNQEGEVAIPIAATSAQAYIAHEDSAAAFFLTERSRGQGSGAAPGNVMANFSGMTLGQRGILQPVPIYVGRAPGWNGPASGPTVADEEPLPEVAAKPGRKSRSAARARSAKGKAAAARQAVQTKPKSVASKPAATKPVVKASAIPQAAKPAVPKPPARAAQRAGQ